MAGFWPGGPWPRLERGAFLVQSVFYFLFCFRVVHCNALARTQIDVFDAQKNRIFIFYYIVFSEKYFVFAEKYFASSAGTRVRPRGVVDLAVLGGWEDGIQPGARAGLVRAFRGVIGPGFNLN